MLLKNSNEIDLNKQEEAEKRALKEGQDVSRRLIRRLQV